MLDAFIIEQIRRREEQDSNRAQHENRLQLPVPYAYEDPSRTPTRRGQDEASEPPAEGNRGVVVVDMCADQLGVITL